MSVLAPAPTDESNPTRKHLGLRVLTVEDDRLQRHVLKAALHHWGCTVVEAADGQEAVERFFAGAPDLVLLDVEMPVMDGLEACRRIKASGSETFTPVIFLTAHDEEETLVRCLNAGGDDFIAKPVSRSILGAKLAAMSRILRLQTTTIAQKEEIERHRLALLDEQEMAKALFERVVQGGSDTWSNVKCTLSPSSVFNGDFVLVARRPGGAQHVLVGDFTGHGLPAAMGAVPVAELFYRMTRNGFGIDQIAARINHRLHHLMPTGRFLAAALLELDMRDRRLRVINAGLPDLIVTHPGSPAATMFPSQNLPFGLLEHCSMESTLIQIVPGSAVYVCSDGIVEAASHSGETFGLDGILRALTAAQPSAAYDAVLQAFSQFRQGEVLADDATFVEMTCQALPDSDASKTDRAPRADAGVYWHIESSFDADALRAVDVQQVATSVLAQLLAGTPARDRLLTVLVELVNNAIDHGILELDSRLKSTPAGFMQYYEERARRLETLVEGRLRLRLWHTSDGMYPAVRLRISDSGAGFDHATELARSTTMTTMSSPVYSGRGLALVRALSRELQFHAGGSEAEVVVDLKP